MYLRGATDLSQLTLFGDAMKELRDIVTKRLNQAYENLKYEHNVLDQGHPSSPYLTDFEEFYRKKMMLGKLTQAEVDAKIEKAVKERGISQEEANHMKKHLRAKPATKQEIEAAVKEEMEKEALKEEMKLEKTLRELREAEIQSEREAKRRLREQATRQDAATLMANRKITRRGRTLVIGKNGQLYVFRKKHQGRLKITGYYHRLQGEIARLGGKAVVRHKRTRKVTPRTRVGE